MKLKTLLGALYTKYPIYLHIYEGNNFIFAKLYTWEECFDFGHLKVIGIIPSEDCYNIEVLAIEEK